MTFAEIKTHFWTLLGASASASTFSNDMLLEWANAAIRDLVDDCQCLERRQAINVEASTQTYDLPDDCDRVLRAAHDGDKLIQATKSGLQESAYRWDSDTGTPRWYFVDMLNEQIGLYPVPNLGSTTVESTTGYGVVVSDTGFGVVVDDSEAEALEDYGAVIHTLSALELEVYFTARAATMDGDDDVPSIPAWAHPLVLYAMLRNAYAAHTLMNNPNSAAYWSDLYQYGKRRLKRQSNDKLPKDWRVKTRDEGYYPRVSRLPTIIPTS